MEAPLFGETLVKGWFLITSTVNNKCDSVFVWWSFTFDDVENFYGIDGVFKKDAYGSILEKHAITSELRLTRKSFHSKKIMTPKTLQQFAKCRYLHQKEKVGILTITP